MKKILLLFLCCIGLSYSIGAKYLIIVPDSNYYYAVKPLANWKHKKGVPTKIVTLGEIGTTGSDISGIKNYIVNAYNTWSPAPEYVLIAGSTNYISTDAGAYDGYYANMSGDYHMEITVSRIPSNSLKSCSTAVAKSLFFERTPYVTDPNWYRKGLGIVNEDGSTHPDTVYWNDVRYVYNHWQNAGFIQIDSLSRLRGNTLAQAYSSINDGRGYIIYRGEAVTHWGTLSGDPFAVVPNSCNNGFKMPVVISATCHTNDLTSENYQCTEFLFAGTPQSPKGGVAACGTMIATSGTGLGRCRGLVGDGIYNAIFKENIYQLGKALKRAKFFADSTAPLNWTSSRYNEWVMVGDPELNCWTTTPQQLTVTHDTIIYTGPQTYNVTVKIGSTPLYGALVCVMMDTTIYQYITTNSSGVASFSISAPVGLMSVTVTARNCIPYEKNVTIQPGGLNHDVSIYSIIEPVGTIASGISVYPKVKIINYGSVKDSFPVTFKIGSIYTQTISEVKLNAGDTVTKQFPVWTSVLGSYTTKAYTSLSTDQWRANDTACGSISVLYANDVGVDSIIKPDTICALNTALIPQARVKNYGAASQINFSVICSIVGANGIIRYYNSQTISLAATRDTIISFSSWTPTIAEKCTIKIRTSLSGDMNATNDRKTKITNIIPISEVIIGTGTSSSYYGPMDRYYNYSTHEAIYLQSEIGVTGSITNIAYYKDSGSDISAIESVTIYMKHTMSTTLASGTYSLTGYTQVFSGAFTNNAISGWMQINLSTPFEYNNTDNLQILVIKGYQDWIYGYPYWRYTSTSYYRTRQASLDNYQPTSLTQTYYRPNIKINLSSQPPLVGDVGVLVVLAPSGIACEGQGIIPQAIIKNFGTNSQTFSATFKVGTNYSQTVSSISLDAGLIDTIDFPSWTAVVGTYSIKCYTQLASDENPNNDTAYGSVICRETYANNFESSNGNFSSSSGWQWGAPSLGPSSAHSGTNLWATVLGDSYSNNVNWKLISSEFYAASDNPQLKFWQWYDMEKSSYYPGRAYDGGNLKISTDSGNTWNLIRPVGGYNAVGYTSNAGIPSESCFSGVGTTWSEVTYDLPVISGQEFYICWHFGSDNAVVRPGWYIDDITTTNVISSGINDVGCISILSPASTVDSGTVINPTAIIHNYSTSRATFNVKFDINDGYTSTRSISAPPGVDTLINFTGWTARSFGTFSTKCSTRLSDDENAYNNKTTGSVHVKFHDVGAYRITSPKGNLYASSIEVSGKIKNYYTRTASCSTRFIIRTNSGNVVFNQSRFTAGVAPNDTAVVNFGNFPAPPGKFYTKIKTILATDDNVSNDSMIDSVFVTLASPVLQSPNPSVVITTATPMFDWQDVYAASQYQIQIATDSFFTVPIIDSITIQSQLQITSPGLNNNSYFWRVCAGLPNSQWSEKRQFTINTTSPEPPGWTYKTSAPIPTKVGGKFVKDGGVIVAADDKLYAFRGNKSNEFYCFNGTNWTTDLVESIPFGHKPSDLYKINNKKIGKGAAMCYDGNNKIYATKGYGTREFWTYDITKDSWTAKPFIPPEKGIKGGTGLVYRTGKVYMLAGSRKSGEANFFVYDTATNAWSSLSTALIMDGKPYKDGSCIVLCNDTIYALKGNGYDNYFYAYNFSSNSWSTRRSLPLVHPYINKNKKVKDGGSMASDGTKIFAIKGGGINEFWTYLPGANSWTPSDTIRRFYNKSVPKAGASLTYLNGKVYLIKGNNTNEFWQYVPWTTNSKIKNQISNINTQAENLQLLTCNPHLIVTPNPFTNQFVINYAVSNAGNARIELYNSTGDLIKTLINEPKNLGIYSLQIKNLGTEIPQGIYFIKYEDGNNKKEIKIIKI